MNISLILTAIKLVKQNWKVVVSLSAIVVIGLYWWNRTDTINDLTEENLNLKSNIQIIKMHYESEILTLQQKVNEQNSIVEEYERLTEVQKNKLEDVLVEKQRLENKHKKQVEAILHEHKPKSCVDAIKYLIDGVKDLQW